MKEIKDLNFGFADAENYKRREHRELFNKVFIKNSYLESLCNTGVSFLIGEKGTGKTAYAVYLANNDYKNNIGDIKYIRETEYQKFIALKNEKHLQLSDYTNIWKVIIYLLLCQKIDEKEGSSFNFRNFGKFNAIRDAIEEYYYGSFSPEIIQALELVQNSSLAAEVLSKHTKIKGEQGETYTFHESRFQTNLFYIQKKFEDAIKQIRLSKNYILFIDGIDIRPSAIPYDEYLECIKGLANAVWEVNNDFFPTIKGGKGRCRAVLLVRPDIFDSIGLQNQNTKIRDNSVYLNWRTDYISHRRSEIFRVADHIIAVQQDDQLPLGSSWDYYFPWDSPNVYDAYDESIPTSFINFLRWSYYRPRDIITLLTLIQENKSNISETTFLLEDFENPSFQRAYSNYLLGEVKDQLSFYYSSRDYEHFLKFFEFFKGRDRFKYDQYCEAYENFKKYMDSVGAELPIFMRTENEFLQFLYDLNLLCYFERTEGKPLIHWCFKERNYSNISPKVKVGLEYQVFYGLAKALNLGQHYS
jgi:hypothetical protein